MIYIYKISGKVGVKHFCNCPFCNEKTEGEANQRHFYTYDSDINTPLDTFEFWDGYPKVEEVATNAFIFLDNVYEAGRWVTNGIIMVDTLYALIPNDAIRRESKTNLDKHIAPFLPIIELKKDQLIQYGMTPTYTMSSPNNSAHSRWYVNSDFVDVALEIGELWGTSKDPTSPILIMQNGEKIGLVMPMKAPEQGAHVEVMESYE